MFVITLEEPTTSPYSKLGEFNANLPFFLPIFAMVE
jgi:hypothetical protein